MKSLRKEILGKKYEMMEDGGLYLPAAKVTVGGVFQHWINDDKEGIQFDPNIVVNEGLDHILDATLSNGTQNSTWYVGIFGNNYTPAAADTADGGGTPANSFWASGQADEVTTQYTEGARPTWTDAGVTSQAVSNTASPAVFTFGTADNVYGAGLVSTNTKAGTTGILMAASKFAAVRAMLISDVLNVTYSFTIADV